MEKSLLWKDRKLSPWPHHSPYHSSCLKDLSWILPSGVTLGPSCEVSV